MNVMLDEGGILTAIHEDPETCEEVRWGKKLAAVRVRLPSCSRRPWRSCSRRPGSCGPRSAFCEPGGVPIVAPRNGTHRPGSRRGARRRLVRVRPRRRRCAVTDCLTDAGATVEESLRFAQLFPYAIAVRTLDRVEEYPELEGARFFSVRYGESRAILFIGKGDEAATAFESTLVHLMAIEGHDVVAAGGQGVARLAASHIRSRDRRLPRLATPAGASARSILELGTSRPRREHEEPVSRLEDGASARWDRMTSARRVL